VTGGADAEKAGRAARAVSASPGRGIPASIYRASDGRIEENLAPPRIMEVLKEGGELWVDIDATDRAQHALLEKVFAFHPLAIDDTLSPRTRVKLEEYGNYLFLAVRSVSFDRETEDPYDVNTVNLYCFLAPHVLVTVHSARVCAVDEMHERLARSTDKVDRGVEMLLHGLLDIIVDEYIPLVDQVDDLVDKLEERLFENYDENAIKEIFAIKRLVVQLRRHLGPLREVLNVLTNRPHSCIDQQSQLYFRDVYDHTIRIVESLESVRDLVATVLDTYLTQTSNRMNKVMKQLNVVATISLPLVVIGGIFGMNFSWMPMTHSPFGFFGALGIMALSAVLIWMFLKRRNWV
jgi:magnesium transporter